MASYIALLRKDTKSDYSVDFPDFPGCVTAGTTLEQARRRAAEALAFHLEGMEEDGAPIPAPRTLDQIMADAFHADAVPFLVTVEPGSVVQRVNITMPAAMLQQIDAYAAAIGMNRSAFLAHAAKRELAGTGRRVVRHGRAKVAARKGTARRRAPRRA